jgi:hypothetical protein
MRIDITKVEYPEMNRIDNQRPNPHILLGKEIIFQEKRDGTNIGCYLDENDELQLRTRNTLKAEKDFYTLFNSIDGLRQKITDLLFDARNWKNEYVVFGELMRTGTSYTKSERRNEPEFVVFDIWSNKGSNFMPYILAHQHAHHFNLSFVEVVGKCISVELDHLYDFKYKMLEWAKEHEREGVVGKIYGDEPIFFKEKLDTPKMEKIPTEIQEGKIVLPELPDSEVNGAIEKVIADIGFDNFRNIKVAMPKIAEYVGIECKKHNCRSPSKKLIFYYNEKLPTLNW